MKNMHSGPGGQVSNSNTPHDAGKPASAKEIALSWVALGLRVFPVALIGTSKVPWVRWKDEATTDPAVIKDWFDRWPTCVPGVVMEGVVAIDFDRMSAQWEYGYNWSQTWKQHTRKGIHYPYRGEVPCSVKVLGSDIDTRGTVNGKSGYIVAYSVAPASLDAFAPTPQWLLDWAAKRGQQVEQSYASDDGIEFDTEQNIRAASKRLLAIAPVKAKKGAKPTIAIGQRNNFIYQAAREVQKFDLTRECTLELMVTLFDWEGDFEENVTALDSAFASRHPEAGLLNPQRVFGDMIGRVPDQAELQRQRDQAIDRQTKSVLDRIFNWQGDRP